MPPPAERTRRFGSARGILAALAGIALLSGVLLIAFSAVRHSVDRAQTRTDNAQLLLVAQVDRETGLRGFALTGLESELVPYVQGRRLLAQTFSRAQREAAEISDGEALLAQQQQLSDRWGRSAQQAITRTRAGGRPTLASTFVRDQLMQRFRLANTRYTRAAKAQETRDIRAASRTGVIVAAIIAFAITFSAIFVIQSQRRRERHGKERQQADERERHAREQAYIEKGREFAQVLQFAESEAEARALVSRHLEAEIPACRATILDRDPQALAAPGNDAEPAAEQRGCVALRIGQVHHEQPGELQLVRCEVCGEGPGRARCIPIRVGARTLGALLVRHEAPLRPVDERLLAETVSYAGPLLANLRTLADTQELALTDALSGLANRRALDDAFARQVAQARRSERPLSALMLDLDRFKLVNDRYGHDRGDDVLARVSLVVREAARDSDFKARFGGEEFVVLLPDTDAAGAVVVAEKLREAIGSIVHPGLERSVTVSIGVATFPADGDSPDTLLHSADQALYEAKHAGRNRVRTVEQIDPDPARHDA